MGFKNYNKEQNNEEEKIKQEANKINALYNEYKGMSEDELINELYKYVAKQKQDGTFDYDSLNNMLNQLTPFLTSEQQNKMKDILNSLK